MATLKKPIDALQLEDIQVLINEDMPEGQQLEFKETIPTKKGAIDAWIQGKGGLGDYGRNELLKELVAFANSTGGLLILGIRETPHHPPRAEKIKPLPRCHDLADTLRKQARDCIEPQLPVIEAVGIPVDGSGSGIVVMSAPRSLMAPHRLKQTLQCYVRRADRSEAMTMREIQDLTLLTSRGMDLLEHSFRDLRRRANKQRNSLLKPEVVSRRLAPFRPVSPKDKETPPTVWLHIIGVPVASRVYIADIQTKEGFLPARHEYEAEIGNLGPLTLSHPAPPRLNRPILRGIQWLDSYNRNAISCVEVYEDGKFMWWIDWANFGHSTIRPGTILALATSALRLIETIRAEGNAPDIEYGLELRLCLQSEKPFSLYELESEHDVAGHFETSDIQFPRYSIGSSEDFDINLDLICRDLFNCVGRRHSGGFKLK